MNPIQSEQLDLYGRTSADWYFNDIQVVLMRPRDREEALLIQTKIDHTLAGFIFKDGKAGAAVIVNMPVGKASAPDSPGPRLEQEITLTVVENPVINMGATGTGKTAEDIVIRLLMLHHQFTIRNLGCAILAAPTAFHPQEKDLAKGRIVYDVNFRAVYTLQPETKAVMPKIQGDASAVTLSTISDGAAIFYTTDGTYPWSGNDQAVEYTVPFNTTAGTLVRAVAYKTNQQASDLAAKLIQ